MKLENWAGLGILALGAYVVYKISKGLSAAGDAFGAGASAVGQAVTDNATGNPLQTDDSNLLGTDKPKKEIIYKYRTVYAEDPLKQSYIPKGYSGDVVQIGTNALNKPIYSTNVAGQPSFVRDFGNKMSVFNYEPNFQSKAVTFAEPQSILIKPEATFSNSLKAATSALIHTNKKGTSTTVTYGAGGVKTIVKKLVNVKKSRFN